MAAIRLPSVRPLHKGLAASIKNLHYWQRRWAQGRNLSDREIQILERQGCRASDWENIRVDRRFLAARVEDCRFEGKVRLPRFSGRLRGAGLPNSFPRFSSGLRNCRIEDCVLENCAMEEVGIVKNQWIERGAVLFDVGALVAGSRTAFGLGLYIHPGSEARLRRVWLHDCLDLDLAQELAGNSPEQQNRMAVQIQKYTANCSCPLGYVGGGALIANSSRIEDVWIGPASVVEGLHRLSQSCLLGDADFPVVLRDGILLERTLVKRGVHVESGAKVQDSALMPLSRVELGACVTHSVIGRNSQVGKGEMTACLVGPNTRMHHQSLLISVLCPEGGINVGYGAMVGSNHTGRKPDQEFHCGEGVFFGLGCKVKFPGNLQDSPFSLLPTGLVLTPQRIAYPFSLFGDKTESHLSSNIRGPALLPGWMWGRNPYALFRSWFRSRELKSPGPASELGLFSEKVAWAVLAAMRELKAGEGTLDWYSRDRLPSAGNCSVSSKALRDGIEAYRDYLFFFVFFREYAGRGRLPASGAPKGRAGKPPGSGTRLAGVTSAPMAMITKRILEEAGRAEWPAFLEEGRERIPALRERMAECLTRDYSRGRVVQSDYPDFHSPTPGDDGVFRQFDRESKKWFGWVREAKLNVRAKNRRAVALPD